MDGLSCRVVAVSVDKTYLLDAEILQLCINDMLVEIYLEFELQLKPLCIYTHTQEFVRLTKLMIINKATKFHTRM